MSERIIFYKKDLCWGVDYILIFNISGKFVDFREKI